MKQTEYEQKRAECWEEASRHFGISLMNGTIHAAFNVAFDRAYALGKQKETITQEEIEKAVKESVRKEYLCDKCSWKDDCDFCGGQNTAFDCCECPADEYVGGFEAGANFALGKQEKDADTVISGWIARDANPHSLYIYGREPVRLSNMWSALGRSFAIQIGSTMFPDLTWESGPEQVEIIIKRKKK